MKPATVHATRRNFLGHRDVRVTAIGDMDKRNIDTAQPPHSRRDYYG